MAEELKPCPFCGDFPEMPGGDGTQYEIECGGCGQAMVSVQICDLMTLEERAAETFTNYRYGEQFVERAKLKAIKHWNTRAQLPSQGGEAVAWRVTGRDGLTVTAQYPEWAEADCLLTITPLYTHPADQVAEPDAELVELLKDASQWFADRDIDINLARDIDAKLASLEVKP